MSSLILLLGACSMTPINNSDKVVLSGEVNQLMDKWHRAAAAANSQDYFGAMDTQSIFIGTDASENWKKAEFKTWSKDYFAKSSTWDFKALERNVYFSNDGSTAWFDELLETTNLGVCRGSGVLTKTAQGWTIQHYVLSVTVPNETVGQVTELNKAYEEKIKASYLK